MKISPQDIIEPPRHHLRQLTIIRSLLLIFLWCSFFISFWVKHISLPYIQVAGVLCVFSAVHLLTIFRLQQILRVNEIEFFVQLLIDVVCLNILFYFSGGATNPFVSYLLVPICISAATLSWRFTAFIAVLCVLTYSLLLFFYIALPVFAMDHMHAQSTLSWHIIGMWFNFFLSAMLITYFVVKMAKNLRQQENIVNEMREDELRNEQVVAVATLAAGAAHNINTPLATMTVLLAELRSEYKNNSPLSEDLQLLSQQVAYCAASLKQMVQDSSMTEAGQYKQKNVKNYCLSIVDRWQLMRPMVTFNVHFSDCVAQKNISYDSRLDFAIINLLNNAADANPNNIQIKIQLYQHDLCWQIFDEGEGIACDVSSILGKQAFSTKAAGLGIGMLLSHSTIKHYGGSVIQSTNHPCGTVTTIKIPLSNHR